MEYFYTNDNLSSVMPEVVKDNWKKYGLDDNQNARIGMQLMKDDFVETVFPIVEKTSFNRELGNLIQKGRDGDFFYKVLTEEEAKAKKEEFKQIRAKQKAEKNKPNADVEELNNAVDELLVEKYQREGLINND